MLYAVPTSCNWELILPQTKASELSDYFIMPPCRRQWYYSTGNFSGPTLHEPRTSYCHKPQPRAEQCAYVTAVCECGAAEYVHVCLFVRVNARLNAGNISSHTRRRRTVFWGFFFLLIPARCSRAVPCCCPGNM